MPFSYIGFPSRSGWLVLATEKVRRLHSSCVGWPGSLEWAGRRKKPNMPVGRGHAHSGQCLFHRDPLSAPVEWGLDLLRTFHAEQALSRE